MQPPFFLTLTRITTRIPVPGCHVSVVLYILSSAQGSGLSQAVVVGSPLGEKEDVAQRTTELSPSRAPAGERERERHGVSHCDTRERDRLLGRSQLNFSREFHSPVTLLIVPIGGDSVGTVARLPGTVVRDRPSLPSRKPSLLLYVCPLQPPHWLVSRVFTHRPVSRSAI
jgi:hypothetical protein